MLSAIIQIAALALPPTVLSAPAPQAPENTSVRTYPIVVVHPDDQAVRAHLLRTLDVWHDAGRFIVGEADTQRLRWLDGLDVDVFRLGGYSERAELYQIEFTSEDTLDRIEAVGGEVLFRYAPQALVALLPEASGILDEVEPGSMMHHALMPISQHPRKAPRPFVVPGGSGSARMTMADPRVQVIVDMVDKSNIEATVQSLSSIYSRRATLSGAVTAQNQLEAQLQSYGISTSLQNFGSSYSRNVIGEIPGTVDPSKIIIVGGHYDSINLSGSSQPAPGADDNASGTAGVMEAARVIALHGPYRHTLRFIGFSGEELGLYGSRYAATLSDDSDEDIIAMLNLDMISYRAVSSTRDVDFITSSSHPALIDFCDAMGALYVSNWASKLGILMGGSSDHAPYTKRGFPAVFYFEDADQYCPWIHTANDSYPQATNDFDLAEMFVKGAVAAAATLASPVDLSITHTPLDDTQSLGPYDFDCQATSLTGSNITSVVLYYSFGGSSYTQVPMTHQGGNDWHAQVPGVGSPVTCCYYIDAFDDQGQTETLPFGMDFNTPPFSFFVGSRVQLYFSDFEGGDDDGWYHNEVTNQDDWQRGAPQGKEGDPTSAHSGSSIWGNDLGALGWNGRYASNTHNRLFSPVFDFTDDPVVILEYQRWLVIQQAPYDRAEIWIGSKEVWQSPAGADLVDTEWTTHTLDISQWAAGKSWVRIEFHLISNGSVEHGGWNIDDFGIYGLSQCATPVPYCTAMPNSEGNSAIISSLGTGRVWANDLVLTVEAGPRNQFGLFFYGPDQISLPFGEGLRCVGGGIYRLPVVHLDTFGNGAYSLDNTDPPEPAAQIEPGDTWNFQFWYRDPPGGPSGFNFTGGLEVLFCP